MVEFGSASDSNHNLAHAFHDACAKLDPADLRFRNLVGSTRKAVCEIDQADVKRSADQVLDITLRLSTEVRNLKHAPILEKLRLLQALHLALLPLRIVRQDCDFQLLPSEQGDEGRNLINATSRTYRPPPIQSSSLPTFEFGRNPL